MWKRHSVENEKTGLELISDYYKSDSDSDSGSDVYNSDDYSDSDELDGLALAGKGRRPYTVPKDEDDMALAKLKDSVTKVANLTDHEIFEMWRTLWSIAYVSKEEEAVRFLIFQKAIVDQPRTSYEYHQKNLPGFADRIN
ncbi:hypothetical protein P8452_73003 [Trifolium repens]|nr:hypothetical protein P8452_73003 [Trifolium repens]